MGDFPLPHLDCGERHGPNEPCPIAYYKARIAALEAENRDLHAFIGRVHGSAWYCDDWKDGVVSIRKMLREELGRAGPTGQAAPSRDKGAK